MMQYGHKDFVFKEIDLVSLLHLILPSQLVQDDGKCVKIIAKLLAISPRMVSCNLFAYLLLSKLTIGWMFCNDGFFKKFHQHWQMIKIFLWVVRWPRVRLETLVSQFQFLVGMWVRRRLTNLGFPWGWDSSSKSLGEYLGMLSFVGKNKEV